MSNEQEKKLINNFFENIIIYRTAANYFQKMVLFNFVLQKKKINKKKIRRDCIRFGFDDKSNPPISN